ncbi:toll/interleukin-1 receptor domain-containing protein [Mucilaginibacter robiniae]|uniref:Toll/interleukin-1 receptor domain-containing protein n=1 Tax=Mucilaginibacter robiniae TaxID=2728022 RepID=A0A7L5DWL1_9SPHI|nr:toll/interleukin-1 receptor domain-containing protein [Mucilaginibacter robiniae]QJD95480.1 toll/interleukin-1 receptor domain-containing protein [Mucilaginibacter robiniae]
MLHFNGTFIGDKTVWELCRFDDSYKDDGVMITFHSPYQLSDREAINYLKTHLPEQEQRWLTFNAKKWTLNLDVFKAYFQDELIGMLKEDEPPEPRENVIFLDLSIPSKLTIDLFKGELDLVPEVSQWDVFKETKTSVNFIFTYDQLMENQPKRIFLSHKSADKPLVRAYRDILKTLSFEPWMDEDDMKAGDKLHRSIAQGFKDSCAAIFFITGNYIDEKYLATEVDYAMTEHYDKGDRFRIIVLVIAEPGETTQVPQLLQQFVYKHPKSQFEGLTEILRALPIKIEFINYTS